MDFCSLPGLKGIVSDSNNIFLQHESEDVKKKEIISKIFVNSNFMLQVLWFMCISIAP